MDLKKYNSKMLAVLGTMAIVGVGIIILITSFFLIEEIIRTFNRPPVNNALTIEKSDEEIKTRDQEITFGSPRLIDTLKTLYIIPVSLVTLEEPEVMGEVFDYEPAYERSKFSRGSSFRGLYSNVLLYYQSKNLKEYVFNEKAIIVSFNERIVQDKQYLLIKATKLDTNNNNKLESNDLMSFFIYDIENKKLYEFSFESMGLVNYHVTYNSHEIILRYGKDKNRNGEIEEYEEPKVLKSVSLETFQSSDLIEESMVQEIQSLVD